MKIEIFDGVFLCSATGRDNLPKGDLPEVSFSGRSNVGKSSLINSIVLRKNLALTSSTPGKTRLLNFFDVAGKWRLVDMPGFGYAAIDKDSRESWAKMNTDYLTTRENLKLSCLLIDSRHDPSPIDIGLIEMLENAGKQYLIIMTKCDKINQKAIDERHKQIKDLVQNCKFCEDVLPYSSKSNLGRKELIGVIKRATS